MKVQNGSITLKTKGFCHVIDITDQVQEYLDKSAVQNGLMSVFVVGSTAALTTLEYEPGLVKDLEKFFESLIPKDANYDHEQTWHDGNGFSHVRASLLKPSLTVPIANGALTLGSWQQIVLVDFDNRSRSRTVAIQVMGQ